MNDYEKKYGIKNGEYLFKNKKGGVFNGQTFSNQMIRECKADSYTHLDVYKRQVYVVIVGFSHIEDREALLFSGDRVIKVPHISPYLTAAEDILCLLYTSVPFKYLV